MIIFFAVVVVVALIAVEGASANSSVVESNETTTTPNDGSKKNATIVQKMRIPGTLRPEALPGPTLFTNFSGNYSVRLPGKHNQRVYVGSVMQINKIDATSSSSATMSAAHIAYLPKLVDKGSVRSLLSLLRGYHDYDEDPDTVDGMPTYEIFVASPDLESSSRPSMKILDQDSEALPERRRLRRKLSDILDPLLKNRITPFVQEHYAHICQKNGTDPNRSCTPCYSLVRRYRHGERQSHATHHALVTVVVSLTDYGIDYQGGLYVSTGYGQRQYVPLAGGDGVAHQSFLLHGVKVLDLPANPEKTERWSWILWYRDSVTCQDYSHEWFATCSDAGDPVCQYLHATKAGNIPGSSGDIDAIEVLALNRAAAEQGSGNAAIKVARAYLKLLPSMLAYNETEAARYFRVAVDSHHPDGHYGLALLLLAKVSRAEADGKINTTKRQKWKEAMLSKAVWHLEEAAMLGHAFAMFNLGIAHIYGYGTKGNDIDTELAALWLVESGLPEAYYIASFQAASVGNAEGQRAFDKIARSLGYYQPWRKEVRARTGSGGAGGVDINLPWPLTHDGRTPPIF
jgi:hypothetical protein